ncbi:hypothetical protein TRFO_13283 [Tritrichomonas foetus]|uniref:Uncharacterized protein n=1 Tax=Tritrichomonas foetus TaxID=1144522 RepID=A0A1J4L2U9_9EUKA|nr:hypothetical protein [Tritrichomonas foetus]OHT16278.1 hypothetical protein TRFO_13283 [Tritrichomonas foetus]|eukprot:OHT16278.1 hypothetical protein TRFO_13283 [Tritrichomonas foetus]
MNQSSFTYSTPSRSMNSTFTRSTPTPIQSFADFQNSRNERLDQINDDIRIQKERKIKELNEQLQSLTLEVNAAQASLATEERDFLEQQEKLITQLNRIKIDAEVKAEECKMEHTSKLEQIFQQHSNAIREVTQQIQDSTIDSSKRQPNPELLAAKSQLTEYQSHLRDLKASQIDDDDDDEADEHDQQMFAEKIRQLDIQRKNLIEEFKQNQATHKSKIVELTLALDEQDTAYQKEISEIQDNMQKREVQYRQQLEKCFKQLKTIQDRHSDVVAQRRIKVSNLQNEIREIQENFHEKMQKATKLAERLKAALVNVNLRKSQQLQVEKEASSEQQALLRENYALQQQLYNMQKQLAGYKEEFSAIRKELSATIGPRRTASLFY